MRRAAPRPRGPQPSAEIGLLRRAGTGSSSRRAIEKRRGSRRGRGSRRRRGSGPAGPAGRASPASPRGFRPSRGRATRSRRPATRIWWMASSSPASPLGSCLKTARTRSRSSGEARSAGVLGRAGVHGVSYRKGRDASTTGRSGTMVADRYNAADPPPPGSMKIAAIDLGSNSIHLVIVEVRPSGGFHVVASEKEMVRLGATTLSAAISPPPPWPAAWRSCASTGASAGASGGQDPGRGHLRHPRSAERRGLPRCGSARRRASGPGWPRARERRASSTWLPCTAFTSKGGARSSWTSAGAAWSWRSGAGTEARLGGLGEARACSAWPSVSSRNDPLAGKDEERLEAFVEAALAPHEDAIKAARPFCAIGTSGTILALGRLAHQRETGEDPESLNHVTVKAATLRRAAGSLTRQSLRERLRLPGMDEPRADILPVGAVIARHHAPAPRHRGAGALRVGAARGHPARLHPSPPADPRPGRGLSRRAPAQRHGPGRALPVRRGPRAPHRGCSSLQLFDATRVRHGLGDGERSLLEYAALLHDIGHHISYPGHHKHTYYLIKNGDLRGFHPAEIEVLANVARYHRRGHPRRKHPGLRRPAQAGAAGGGGPGGHPARGRRPRPQPQAGGAPDRGERAEGRPAPAGRGSRRLRAGALGRGRPHGPPRGDPRPPAPHRNRAPGRALPPRRALLRA